MGLNSYQDKWTRWHDKPCPVKDSPSSNNGWVYSCYADLVNLPTNKKLLTSCFVNCIISKNPIHINRSPGKRLPYISKDEILGLYLLDMPQFEEMLLADDFMMFNAFPKIKIFSVEWLKKFPVEAAKAIWNYKDRNYIWEQRLYTIFPFMFKLPAPDRHFIKRHIYKRRGIKVKGYYNPIEWLKFYIGGWYNSSFGSNSVKNYLYTQFWHLGHDWFLDNWFDPKKSFVEYFGQDHPIAKRWLRKE